MTGGEEAEYLDKLDKELKGRGLCFVRYADDCNIFVRSEVAANRVMASSFLGFTFWKTLDGWKPKPLAERKARLCGKVKETLVTM